MHMHTRTRSYPNDVQLVYYMHDDIDHVEVEFVMALVRILNLYKFLMFLNQAHVGLWPKHTWIS